MEETKEVIITIKQEALDNYEEETHGEPDYQEGDLFDDSGLADEENPSDLHIGPERTNIKEEIIDDDEVNGSETCMVIYTLCNIHLLTLIIIFNISIMQCSSCQKLSCLDCRKPQSSRHGV